MRLPFFKKKKKHSLYNPYKAKNEGEENQPEFPIELETPIPETQIKLGIKESKLEPVFKVKRSISKMELTADAIPFWKSTISVIVLSFSIITLVILSFLIYY